MYIRIYQIQGASLALIKEFETNCWTPDYTKHPAGSFATMLWGSPLQPSLYHMLLEGTRYGERAFCTAAGSTILVADDGTATLYPVDIASLAQGLLLARMNGHFRAKMRNALLDEGLNGVFDAVLDLFKPSLV